MSITLFLEEVKRNTAEVRCVSERLTQDQKDSDFKMYKGVLKSSRPNNEKTNL